MTALAGRTVAILEARRSAELAKLFEHEGAAVFVAPALREEPVDEHGEVSRFVDELCSGAFELLLCLTGVGVRGLIAAAERLNRRDQLIDALGKVPTFCRGPKPVAALRALGLRPSHTTPSPHTSRQVLDVAAGLDLAGKRVGVIRHGGSSTDLIDGLHALGALVHEVQVYQWALPDDVDPIRGLFERLLAGSIDAIAFTSASQIHNLFAVAEQLDQAELLHRLIGQVKAIVAVGPVCADAIREHSLRIDVQPAEPKMGPMVLALGRFFASISAPA